MRSTLAVAALVLFFAVSPARAGTYSMVDTSDGWIYSGSPNGTMFNFSFGPPGLLPTARTGVIAGTTHDITSLLKFSLTNLPLGTTGADITSAALTLRTADAPLYPANHGAAAPTVAVPFVVDLFAAAASWNSTTSWNTQPAATTALPIVQVSVTDTTDLATSHLVDVTFDVTSIVKDWVDGGYANNGFMLKGDAIVGDGTPAAMFMSRGYTFVAGLDENNIPIFAFAPQSNGPQLVVTTVPEPSAALLALAAAPALVGLAGARRRRRAARQ